MREEERAGGPVLRCWNYGMHHILGRVCVHKQTKYTSQPWAGWDCVGGQVCNCRYLECECARKTAASGMGLRIMKMALYRTSTSGWQICLLIATDCSLLPLMGHNLWSVCCLAWLWVTRLKANGNVKAEGFGGNCTQFEATVLGYRWLSFLTLCRSVHK